MSPNPVWSLNLKQKVILSLALFAAGLTAVGSISYDDLITVGQKVEVVRSADNLRNLILEARRSEKNYLLYHQADDLDSNRQYVAEAREAVQAIKEQMAGLQGEPRIHDLAAMIDEYRNLMDQLAATVPETAGYPPALIQQVREHGQRMLEITQHEVAFEGRRIQRILLTLKYQLIVSLLLALFLGGVLPFVMLRQVFKPLDLIMRTTEEIAQGRFEKIPVVKTRDEMQRMMEAFNRMVQELEQRQEQLIQTQKLSSIGTLTAGVAHQLNNPLNNISTSCQIAIEEADDPDRTMLRRMLANIEQETMRARDTVKGLLEFSRVQVFARRLAPLAEVVERTLRLVASQVPSGIEIVTRVPPDLTLDLDVQRMQEALLNLLINAVQAMTDGQGRITIAARPEPGRGRAVITVADTGPGIPRDIQSRVFDPFFTTKEEGQGTGLGLSIVYGIVKQHYGTISIESEEGRGTTFTIGLPLAATGREGA